jgi:hypothetical protein
LAFASWLDSSRRVAYYAVQVYQRRLRSYSIDGGFSIVSFSYGAYSHARDSEDVPARGKQSRLPITVVFDALLDAFRGSSLLVYPGGSVPSVYGLLRTAALFAQTLLAPTLKRRDGLL